MDFGHYPRVLWPKHVDYGQNPRVFKNKCLIPLLQVFPNKVVTQGFLPKTRLNLRNTLIVGGGEGTTPHVWCVLAQLCVHV